MKLAFSSNPFRPLPHGAGMRVSVRRTTRVGALEGTPLEDLGVEPDIRHRMTRQDVLGGNRDLFEHAGRLLKELPVHRLDFEVETMGDGEIKLTVHASNVDRVDVYVDGRPMDSFDIVDIPTVRRTRPPSAAPTEVELQGFFEGKTVARARRAIG